MTRWPGIISVSRFMQICAKGERTDGSALYNEKRINHIRTVLSKMGKDPHPYTGRGLISMILPEDLYFEMENNAHPNEPWVRIYQGVMYEGALDKKSINKSRSLIQILYKEYGPSIAANFIDNLQFMVIEWMLEYSFSIGLEDCMMTDQSRLDTIKETLVKCYVKAEGIERSTMNPGIREVRITAALSQARDVGMRIASEAMDIKNNFLSTVKSGSKG